MIGVDAEGRRWERQGDCNRCGSCCAGCVLLAWDGRTAVCTDRQAPYYLAGCNVWPSVPQQLDGHPDCSYTFTEVGTA